MVLGYVKNDQDAEEIVQDTIMAAFKGLDRFDGRSSLKTWVYRIAINRSKEKLKYKSRLKRSGNVISLMAEGDEDYIGFEPANYFHPGDQMESKEKLEILFLGISNLPVNQQKALTLNKLEQLNIRETAEIMDMSYKAVESLLSRAKSNLKKYLLNEGFQNFNKRI